MEGVAAAVGMARDEKSFAVDVQMRFHCAHGCPQKECRTHWMAVRWPSEVAKNAFTASATKRARNLQGVGSVIGITYQLNGMFDNHTIYSRPLLPSSGSLQSRTSAVKGKGILVVPFIPCPHFPVTEKVLFIDTCPIGLSILNLPPLFVFFGAHELMTGANS